MLNSLTLIFTCIFAFGSNETDLYALYTDSSPTQGTRVANITIADVMEILLSVTIHSFPNSTIDDGWTNIYHVGNKDSIRMPAVFLHSTAGTFNESWTGFTVVYSTVFNWNDHQVLGGALAPNMTYDLIVQVNQSSYNVFINDINVYSNTSYPAHELLVDQIVWLSDPWFQSPDVTLHKLIIRDYLSYNEPIIIPTNIQTLFPTIHPTVLPSKIPSNSPSTLPTIFEFDSNATDFYALYSDTSPIQGTRVANITITDVMEIVLSVTIHSFPDTTTAGWANIYHVGNEKNIRMPAIYIHYTSGTVDGSWAGFLVAYSTVENSNPYQTLGGALTLNITYNLIVQVNQSSYNVFINDINVYSDASYSAHELLVDQTVWLSDPWYQSPDVTVHKFIIRDYLNYTENMPTIEPTYSDEDKTADNYESVLTVDNLIIVIIIVCGTLGLLLSIICYFRRKDHRNMNAKIAANTNTNIEMAKAEGVPMVVAELTPVSVNNCLFYKKETENESEFPLVLIQEIVGENPMNDDDMPSSESAILPTEEETLYL